MAEPDIHKIVEDFVNVWFSRPWPAPYDHPRWQDAIQANQDGIQRAFERRIRILDASAREKYVLVVIRVERKDDDHVLTCLGRTVNIPADPHQIERLYDDLTADVVAQLRDQAGHARSASESGRRTPTSEDEDEPAPLSREPRS